MAQSNQAKSWQINLLSGLIGIYALFALALAAGPLTGVAGLAVGWVVWRVGFLLLGLLSVVVLVGFQTEKAWAGTLGLVVYGFGMIMHLHLLPLALQNPFVWISHTITAALLLSIYENRDTLAPLPVKEQVPKPLRTPVSLFTYVVGVIAIGVSWILFTLGFTVFFNLQGLGPDISTMEAAIVMWLGYNVFLDCYFGVRGFMYFSY